MKNIELNHDWFENRLIVGAFPYKQNTMFYADDYSVVINVSDEWYLDVEQMIRERYVRYYWFPMNECVADIGLNSIYGALTILRHCEEKNLSTYLHCHAGINRSHTVKCAYYYMRTGKQLIMSGRNNPFVLNSYMGKFGILDVNKAIRAVNFEKMQGGILDHIKL